MQPATQDRQDIAEVVVRPMVETDRSFVLATWLNSYRHGAPATRKLSTDLYYRHHHPLAEAALTRSTVSVACLPDTPNVILGYLIVEGPVIHFAYVKQAFRRMRVLSQLLDDSTLPPDLADVAVTHGTHNFFDWLHAKYPACVFNPYLF
jgi:hypothetical protein